MQITITFIDGSKTQINWATIYHTDNGVFKLSARNESGFTYKTAIFPWANIKETEIIHQEKH
jgi:hypothetical protein